MRSLHVTDQPETVVAGVRDLNSRIRPRLCENARL
jgi:hypothetical protein